MTNVSVTLRTISGAVYNTANCTIFVDNGNGTKEIISLINEASDTLLAEFYKKKYKFVIMEHPTNIYINGRNIESIAISYDYETSYL